MSDSPCDFSIQSQIAGQPSDFVRIECRDHLQLLARIDVSPSDFLSALMTGETVTAAFSAGKLP